LFILRKTQQAGFAQMDARSIYAKQKRDEFLILDALPKEWRALVHEYGGNATLRLHRMGISPAAARIELSQQLRAAVG